MSYSDIRKRREAAKPAPKPQPRQNSEAEEVKRFVAGGVYNGYVCVSRWRDEKGVQVGLVERGEHKANVALEHEVGDDFVGAEYYNREFNAFEEFFVRTYKGAEYAVSESDLPYVDGDLSQIEAEDIETADKVAVASAAKMSGVEPLDVPCKKKSQPKPRRRKRKGNPLVGIVLIVIIAALVKSCAG